jgi:hypothetical protein
MSDRPAAKALILLIPSAGSSTGETSAATDPQSLPMQNPAGDCQVAAFPLVCRTYCHILSRACTFATAKKKLQQQVVVISYSFSLAASFDLQKT